ncbi:MAG: S9 family peptidase [Pseudomonadota bacterium]
MIRTAILSPLAFAAILSGCAVSDAVMAAPDDAPAETAEPAVAPERFVPPSSTPGPVSENGGLVVETLATLARISSTAVSPDGSTLAYVIRETDLKADGGRTDIWSLDLTDDDAEPVQLTTHDAGDSSPTWSADGSSIYFLSSRSGSNQAWRIDTAGGAAVQVTDYPIGIANLKVLEGGRIAFTADVFRSCDTLQCTADILAEMAASPTSAMQFDKVFVRHWDTWEDGRRSALFTAELGDGGTAGASVNLSGSLDGDTPSVPFGGGGEIAASPDGQTLYFALREAGETEPWSTDLDIYAVPADGSAAPTNLTDGMDGTDTHPVVSPDGNKLVWLSMARAGYESDQTDLMVLDLATGDMTNPTADWDRSVSDIAFTPDGASVIISASDTGTHPLFRVDLAASEVMPVTTGAYASSPIVRGDQVVYLERALNRPVDIHMLDLASGDTRQLTDANAVRLSETEMGEYEQFSFAGANGETVYGYAMKPAGFEDGETYPIAFIVHGGPQGSFSEGWSYRWNPQIYAGAGYGVVFIDFHGSAGYGQAFMDSINQDWGGKPLEDLEKGLAAATERYDWLDGEKTCALGASYGGYMINWIAGNWPDRFDCLVNHDGLFDLRSFYYSTEELWFPEWDFGGPYFENPESYERWNPVHHVQKWQTPMLVIQGELDFRVPPEQSLATFNALQRQGIESELLWFPDENHWVLKPNNSMKWHHTVLGWLDRHLKAQDEASEAR